MTSPAESGILPTDFYAHEDVVQVSRDLLGCLLCTSINGLRTSGMITETEAYCGRGDQASHASGGTRTKRTEVMYGPPGHSYIYLCYGIHHLFNIVTNREGLADAVLIRSIHPITGIETMKNRRSMDGLKNLANGPGKLSEAMGLHTSMNGLLLTKPPIWVKRRPQPVHDADIQASSRIGVDYAGEDAFKPWRFQIKPPP